VPAVVLSSRPHQDVLLVRFDVATDRERAETFSGQVVLQ
jgi:ribosomal 30S subunit maturation factor RimM